METHLDSALRSMVSKLHLMALLYVSFHNLFILNWYEKNSLRTRLDLDIYASSSKNGPFTLLY